MKYLIKIFLAICFILTLSLAPNGFSAQEVADSSLSRTQNIDILSSPENIIDLKDSSQEEKIESLDLRGIEIVELFKIISRKLDKNIIPSKHVSGRVSLFLNNISYEDLLNIVIISQKLAYIEEDENIIIVMTESEYEELYGSKFNETRKMETLKVKYSRPEIVYNALLELKNDSGTLLVDESSGTIIIIDTYEKIQRMKRAFESLDVPLVTEAFELQYAKADQLKKGIKVLLTEGVGKIIADERTNTLIVSDLPGNMQKIKHAINMIDQQIRQVFIEAAIIKVVPSGNNTYDTIIDDPAFWGTLFTGTFPENIAKTSVGKQELRMQQVENYDISQLTEFINTFGDIEILSRPKFAVINNEEALINVTTKEPIITGSSDADDIDFADVGLKLSLTPTINREDFVMITLRPQISSVTKTLKTGTDNNPRSIVPVIAKAEAQTTVKIKNDSVLMISGLRDTSGGSDAEIIIFLVPHIIKGTELKTKDLETLGNFFSGKNSEKFDSLKTQFKPDLLKKRSTT